MLFLFLLLLPPHFHPSHSAVITIPASYLGYPRLESRIETPTITDILSPSRKILR